MQNALRPCRFTAENRAMRFVRVGVTRTHRLCYSFRFLLAKMQFTIFPYEHTLREPDETRGKYDQRTGVEEAAC